MTINEIEQVAKDYLKSKNIFFEFEKDEWDFTINKINDYLYYVRCDKYSARYEPVKLRYRCVINNKKDIVINLAEVLRGTFICLDKENILITIRSNRNVDYYQHFRIQDDKVKLINTFDEIFIDNEFLKDKLLFCIDKSHQLYNFEKCSVLRDEFDGYYTSEDCKSLEILAINWGVPEKSRQEFIDTISQKMKKEHLIGGYKTIEAKKEGIKKSYHLFIFIDKNGKYVSSLYYVDNSELISIGNIFPEDINDFFNHLEQRLYKEIDAEIAAEREAKVREDEKQNEFAQQLMKEFED